MLRMNVAWENSSQHGKPTIEASFVCLFLGHVEDLIQLMQKSFPELGLVRKDCTEMSWISSVVFMNAKLIKSTGYEAPEILLNRTQMRVRKFKGKSDYVRKPIPVDGLRGLWRLLCDDNAQFALLEFVPYGGRMDEISESEIPFPHRSAYIYHIHYVNIWEEEGEEAEERHMNWIRKVYKYMEPYVSKSPRAAYINYRDLDIGLNDNGYTSNTQASIWGPKYFNNNFKRLARVKRKVDPHNFFRNEQSIPTLSKEINNSLIVNRQVSKFQAE